MIASSSIDWLLISAHSGRSDDLQRLRLEAARQLNIRGCLRIAYCAEQCADFGGGSVGTCNTGNSNH